MSDFILEYDILESIAKNSKKLGESSEEYGESLERKIIQALGSVTGPSSGYLLSANDSVKDKINALKLKSQAFYHFAEQILKLLEVAEQMDQEVADAIAAQKENFLNHHESLRIDDWKAKLLDLFVDIKNSLPLLAVIADVLDGLDTLFESLKDSIKHWYECEGGKYIVKAAGSVLGAVAAIALFVITLPISGFVGVCAAIAAGIVAVNAVTNIATSFRAADAAMDGNPAWAVIYGKQDRLSDVLRQTNFGNGLINDLSNLGAGALNTTELICGIVGLAGMGVSIAKLFKGKAFNLLKNKGSLKFTNLKNGVKNGIVDLKSSIKQGYADLKSTVKQGYSKFKNGVSDFKNKIKLKKTNISSEMQNKILEGQRKSPTKNEVIGGHSSSINNDNSRFAVEELSINPDGTKNVQFTKDLLDGNISKLKKSTLFPDSWSETKIIDSIKKVGNSPIISTRLRDKATWHRQIVDGVEIDVLKIGNDVISGYPTGKVSAPKPSGF